MRKRKHDNELHEIKYMEKLLLLLITNILLN